MRRGRRSRGGSVCQRPRPWLVTRAMGTRAGLHRRCASLRSCLPAAAWPRARDDRSGDHHAGRSAWTVQGEVGAPVPSTDDPRGSGEAIFDGAADPEVAVQRCRTDGSTRPWPPPGPNAGCSRSASPYGVDDLRVAPGPRHIDPAFDGHARRQGLARWTWHAG